MSQTKRRLNKNNTKRNRSLWNSESRKPRRSFSESIEITDEFRKKTRLSIE